MRLLVIDDAPDIATLLKLAFQLDGYAVDTALTATAGLEHAAVNEYDVLILDLNLPDLDGLDVCRTLRAEQPQLLIIILTARSTREQIVAGLDAGADDYLSKPFDYTELVARVRALLRRDMRVRQPLLECGDLKLDPAAGITRQAGKRLQLTRKEFAILEYLLRHTGEIVSQEALLEHVWNAEANPFSNVVRVHINALRRKLGDTAATPRYIETVIGAGYRFDNHTSENLTPALSPPWYAPSNESTNRSDWRNRMASTARAPFPNAPQILIVDDAPDINQLLVAYFHRTGFNTLSAYDGRSGLELFHREHPDLVILDLGLPDLDGLEVCRTIRGEANTPIVMLTARTRPEERESGLQAGANAYITKPFDAEELVAVIQAQLAG